MNTHRKILFAAMGCLLWSTPVAAAPDGTLGMALMAAAINADGTLARGTGVTSASAVAPGAYEIIFDRNVTGCFFTATIGAPAAIASTGGFIEATRRSGNPNGVYVETTTAADVLTDRPFYLTVFCAQ